MTRHIDTNVGVKVLPLHLWMTMPKHRAFPDLETTEPRFNRDGYYLHYDICWFEFNGTAYIYEEEMFRYEIELLENHILSKKENDALTQIRNMGLISKKQLKVIEASRDLRNLRSNKFHNFKIMKKVKDKFKVKKLGEKK